MKIGGKPIRRWCEIAYLEPIHRYCTFVSMIKIGTWRTNPFTKWKLVVVEAIPGNEQITVSIGGELPLSQRFFLKFFFGKEKASRQAATTSPEEARREKNPSLSSSLRDSLSASNVGSLALSRRKFSRKTCGPRVAANQFADDLKIVVQVVHTDGQGHSHRRFRGRLCSSPTACRTTKVVLRALRTYR